MSMLNLKNRHSEKRHERQVPVKAILREGLYLQTRNYWLINGDDVGWRRKSYDWFEQRRKTRGLELAHDQITKAFDTVTWLHKATKSFSEKNFKESKKYIENLYKAEEEVDASSNRRFHGVIKRRSTCC